MAANDLEAKAQDFATELTDTFAGVLGNYCPPFVAETSPTGGDVTRVAVHTEGNSTIPLKIDGEHSLSLAVEFECEWDYKKTYLAVRSAKFHVLTDDERGAPLFRYEFVDGQKATLPCAHLHVHAHRDELLFALFRGGKGKPKTRANAVSGESSRAKPTLADIHFPLGGVRMRPSIEDFLQMLRSEFQIDMEDGFQDLLDEGRARWKRRQIGAAVRDAPAEAAETLRSLGFDVSDPPDGCPPERTDRLKRM